MGPGNIGGDQIPTEAFDRIIKKTKKMMKKKDKAMKKEGLGFHLYESSLDGTSGEFAPCSCATASVRKNSCCIRSEEHEP